MPARQGIARGDAIRPAGWARLALPALAAVAIALVLATTLSGCAVWPSGSPSAQQLYDRALGSTMRDAAFTVSGGGTTALAGLQAAMSLAGNGQLVLKPQAYTMHLIIKMAGQSLNGQVTFDQIAVDGKAYVRVHEQLRGLSDGGSDKYGVSASLPLVPQQIANLKTVAAETVNGVRCWHLSGTSGAADGTSGAATSSGSAVDVWIRQSDDYFVRMQLGALPGLGVPASGSLLGGSSGGINFTLDFSTYNSGATIAPPPADQIAS